ncbi:PREDICTED: dopamine N-acetyltransferase-like [Drosophila arizonae]|uniref:Dopamine N-acetyltransferase-like n=1 Tax=Drosophila arizonae TaxID=7263 RepID=A0ABM1NP76_DROAR|nr:PREDICTED: dopamine N-acetyltransferase-like [Drosophila arizonae]
MARGGERKPLISETTSNAELTVSTVCAFNSDFDCLSDSCRRRRTLRGNEQEDDEYYISMVEQGTSLVAIDEKNGGRIVGIVLAAAHVPSDLNRYSTGVLALTDFERIDIFIAKVENAANLFQRYGVSKMLCSHITNCDATMRGKGLGARLTVALIEVARSKGCPLLVANCTSFYSARQKQALGMECVYKLAYEDYKDETGQVVFNPPEPHTHIRVMAIKL